MGLSNGITKWKKKRQSIYNEYIARYVAINENFQLGIPWQTLHDIAWAYADRVARAYRRSWGGGIFGGQFLKNLVYVVVAAVNAFYGNYVTAGSFFSMALNNVIADDARQQAQKIQQNIKRVYEARAGLQRADEAQKRADSIVYALVYNPYEIFANGEIYKEQQAGSETYSHSLSPDCSKGLLGETQKIEIDEKMHNRGQVIMAGNSQYFSNLLNLGLPLEKAGLSLIAFQDALQNKMDKALERITAGFAELLESSFNELGTAQEIFDMVYEQQIVPYQRKMVLNDTLDKLQNYQLGLRAEIDPLHLQDFQAEPDENAEEEARKEEEERQRQEELKQEYTSDEINEALQIYLRENKQGLGIKLPSEAELEEILERNRGSGSESGFYTAEDMNKAISEIENKNTGALGANVQQKMLEILREQRAGMDLD